MSALTTSSNFRFINTLVDGKPHSIYISKCNFCPLFKLDTYFYKAKCLLFKNPTENIDLDKNTISTVGGYSNRISKNKITRYIPIKDIPIPDWCGLVKNYQSLRTSKELYIHTESVGYKLNILGDTKERLPHISEKYLEFDEYFCLVRVVSPVTKIGHVDTIKIKKCSLCGKEKEEVNRNEKLGMCNECWEANNFQKEKKHHAFINNFRMKRNSDYSTTLFKNLF